MRKIRELTGNGVDVMLDGIGGTNALRSYRALAPSGRPVMFGHDATLEKGRRTTKSMASFYAAGSLTLAGNLLPGGRRVGTYRSAITRDLHPDWYRTGLGVLFRLYLDGHLHPLIASRLSLSGARHAHELLAAPGRHRASDQVRR
jgi:NADPH2:quinone reductase